MKTENVVLIPIRAGSRSIPDKNMKDINKRPLCFWAIDAALEAKYADQVWVSTESDEYAQKLTHYYENMFWIHKRPELLSTDNSTSDDVLLDFAYYHEFTKVVLVQATSPMIMPSDIDNALTTLEDGADSVVSCVKIGKRFVWEEKDGVVRPSNYDVQKRPFRRKCSTMWIENGAMYGTLRQALLKSRCRLSGNTEVVEMPENTLIEVDEQEDWDKVEKLMQERTDEPTACYHYNSSAPL